MIRARTTIPYMARPQYPRPPVNGEQTARLRGGRRMVSFLSILFVWLWRIMAVRPSDRYMRAFRHIYRPSIYIGALSRLGHRLFIYTRVLSVCVVSVLAKLLADVGFLLQYCAGAGTPHLGDDVGQVDPHGRSEGHARPLTGSKLAGHVYAICEGARTYAQLI